MYTQFFPRNIQLCDFMRAMAYISLMEVVCIQEEKYQQFGLNF